VKSPYETLSVYKRDQEGDEFTLVAEPSVIESDVPNAYENLVKISVGLGHKGGFNPFATLTTSIKPDGHLEGVEEY
jgi:hypothetical protein